MSSSGGKGFAYLWLGRMCSFSHCHLLLCHRENWPWNKNVRFNIPESKGVIYNFGPCIVTLWYSRLFVVIAEMKKCYTRINASQTLSITPLSPPSPLVCPTPPSSACTPPPTSVLLLWQVETLIIDFLFSLLSSVHSLQRLPTYLALTEQCCSRRALKDRLDCLGILIPHFFILLGSMCSYSVTHSYPSDIVYPPLSLAIATTSALFLLLGLKNNLCLVTVSFPCVPVCIS